MDEVSSMGTTSGTAMFGHDLAKKFFVYKWYRYHLGDDRCWNLALRHVFGHVWKVVFNDEVVGSGV
jgi:hypothetical protein